MNVNATKNVNEKRSESENANAKRTENNAAKIKIKVIVVIDPVHALVRQRPYGIRGTTRFLSMRVN